MVTMEGSTGYVIAADEFAVETKTDRGYLLSGLIKIILCLRVQTSENIPADK